MNIDKLNKLESKAISFIKTVRRNYEGDLFAGNSGGKDSAIVDYLLQKSGINYISFYTNTTIDPPSTIPHLKKYYPHTQILKPKESFLQLVRRKGLPTRLNRYCCEHLKEYGSVGKMVFEGVRSAESRNRQGRDYIQCDNRKWQKGAKHIYPIYDWTDDDVWDFIKLKEIPLNPSYAKGLKRMGCVGCPLVTKKGVREKEFELFPKFYDNIKRSIEIGMKNNPQWKLTCATDGNGQLAMDWWMSGKTMNEFFREIEITGSKKEGWKKKKKDIYAELYLKDKPK